MVARYRYVLRLTGVLLTTLAAAVVTRPTKFAAHARLASPKTPHQQRQQQHQQQQRPPTVLRFNHPSNGSSVAGPDVHLHYTLHSAAGSGRELTATEIGELAVSTTMCFKLHGFSDKPEICAALGVATVTIKDALPAKWHRVSARMKDAMTGDVWQGPDAEVNVFVALDGYGSLDMCGDSACLDTSDLRSAYFDHVYR